MPPLFAAFDALPVGDPLRDQLAAPIAVLRAWDRRWSADSVATTLACLWGDDLRRPSAENGDEAVATVAAAAPRDKLLGLARVADRLSADFGDWRVGWGQFNRWQRLTDDIEPRFDDAEPSLPAPFTASRWGSLAAFAAKRHPGTKRYYGFKGNSFVAVVEFGRRVRALAVSTGGESGHPGDRHFADQAAAISERRAARGLLLPRPARRACRAGLSSDHRPAAVVADDARRGGGRGTRASPRRSSSDGADIMTDETLFPVPTEWAARARMDAAGYEAAVARSRSDPEGFWRAVGERLDWIEPFGEVKDVSFAKADFRIRWYADGVLNACANCLDRHLPERADEVAIIWEGDDPKDSRRITYAEAHKAVCRMANVLKANGVRKGDRVTIYLPMIPEAAFAMLACARIGAVHSVIFGGFAPD